MKNFKADKNFKLKNYPTKIDDIDSDKAKKELKELRKEIAKIQDKMYELTGKTLEVMVYGDVETPF